MNRRTDVSLPIENFPEYQKEPMEGTFIDLDGWPIGNCIIETDEAEREAFGWDFRLLTGKELIPSLPVEIEITGSKAYKETDSEAPSWFTRVKVTFLTDPLEDKEPTVARGWMKMNDDYTVNRWDRRNWIKS